MGCFIGGYLFTSRLSSFGGNTLINLSTGVNINPRLTLLIHISLYIHIKSPIIYCWLPSGKRLHNYGKSQFSMGKSTISTGPCSSSLCNKLPGRVPSDNSIDCYGSHGPSSSMYPSHSDDLTNAVHDQRLPGLVNVYSLRTWKWPSRNSCFSHKQWWFTI